MKLQLTRYQTNPERTFGFLQLSDGWGCYTLEPPWRNNARMNSCIPDGEYVLAQRLSPIVQRITKGRFLKGYEVRYVPERRYIMIHPGNWVRDTNGCILVGGEPTLIGTELGIPNSQATFTELMRRLRAAGQDSLPLTIQWQLDEFPRHILKKEN